MLLRREELLECAFAAWYPRFRHVSPAAVVLDLAPDFVDYLVSDGIVVAPESKAFLTRAEPDEYADSDDYRTWPEERDQVAGPAPSTTTSSTGPPNPATAAAAAARGPTPATGAATPSTCSASSLTAPHGGIAGPAASASHAPATSPTSGPASAAAQPTPEPVASGGSSSEEEDSEEEGDPAVAVPSYTATMAAIEEALQRLGGKVVPKLNWSCPRDATWINPCNSLACTNADEVLLMLRSSDRVAHDVCHAFDACTADVAPSGGDGRPSTSGGAGQQGQQQQQSNVRYSLALRKWYDLRPERELRAFVRRQQLVGAYPSQTEL